MEIRPNYIIIGKTIVLRGIYYKNGEKFTEVIEGADRFLVAQSPVQIIENSLIKYGSNFKGALESSRLLLGNRVKLNPIMVSSTLDIWIFPTQSYKNQDCIWFVLNHIKGSDSLGIKLTKVYLSYEHTFEIRMRESSFKNKRDNTNELRDKITNNFKNPLTFLAEPQKGFCLVEEKGMYLAGKMDSHDRLKLNKLER